MTPTPFLQPGADGRTPPELDDFTAADVSPSLGPLSWPECRGPISRRPYWYAHLEYNSDVHVLAGLTAGVAVGAQLLLLRTVRRMARTRNRGAVVLSSEVAQLNVEWNGVLTNVFVAARDTIALCPACHLGTDGTCVCQERRQALALAVGVAEEFAAAHASEPGSRRSDVAQ